MSFPEHTNPSKGRDAKAPYNFVPLAEKIVPELSRPDRDVYYSNRFTGVIHCMLKTESPLYTRAALEQDEYRKKPTKDGEKSKNKSDFFYVDPATKQPVIPGSSLRGMLRTLVEIITFSKPQPVTDRQLFFRTLDDTAIGKAYGKRMVGGDRGGQGSYPKVKAGYMERVGHNYKIRPAQTLLTTQFFRVKEDVALNMIRNLNPMAYQNNRGRWSPERSYQWLRQEIWFRPVAPTLHTQSAQFYGDVTDIQVGKHSPGIDWVQGWFIASGWVPSQQGSGKHRHWIIAPPVTDAQQLIDVNDIDIDAYEELGAGRSQTIEKQKMSVLSKRAGELIPCFYADWKDSEGNKRIAFGHTAMFRLPYEYSPRDLLPYSEQQLQITDFAEAIFGWVDDKKGRTIAGRVSVSDAHVTQFAKRLHLLEASEPPLTPLLSGPKPTSFQHYLTQGSDEKKDLYHYQDKDDTTLRGHKLYWHKDDKLQLQDYHDANAKADSTQHTFMRPIDQGVSFAFDIHFENLAAEELGALLWVLRVAGDGKHCLKVGMAKPLGLGSVSVQSRLCLSGRSARYRTLFSHPKWEETPVMFESSQLADTSTSAQFAGLNASLQNNETVEVVDLALFVAAFENFILTQMGAKGDPDDTAFSKLPRVQTLLALLQWPGERRSDNGYNQTTYMGLEEFKQRPVLPDPVWVTQPALQAVPNRRTNTRTVSKMGPDKERVSSLSPQDVLAYITSDRSKIVPSVQQQTPTTLPPLTSLDQLKENDTLIGTVVRVEQDSVLVDLGPGTARLHKDQTHPPTRYQEILVRNFPEGRIIQVWVKGRNRQGKLQLTMKAPSS